MAAEIPELKKVVEVNKIGGVFVVTFDDGSDEPLSAATVDLPAVMAYVLEHLPEQTAPDLGPMLERLAAAEAAAAAVQAENVVQQGAIDLLQATGPGGRPQVKVLQLDPLPWWQSNSPGGRVQVQYLDSDPAHYGGSSNRLGKVVTQAWVYPNGEVFVFQSLVLGDECVLALPDVDPIAGGEWEFRFPWRHAEGVRGYWKETGYLFNADKSNTIPAVTMLRTDPGNILWGSVRRDVMFGARFEKGVCNRREPLLIPNPNGDGWISKQWQPGCVHVVQARYPVGQAVYDDPLGTMLT